MGYASEAGDLPQKHRAAQTGLAATAETGTD
jgi:hypothetical protein